MVPSPHDSAASSSKQPRAWRVSLSWVLQLLLYVLYIAMYLFLYGETVHYCTYLHSTPSEYCGVGEKRQPVGSATDTRLLVLWHHLKPCYFIKVGAS